MGLFKTHFPESWGQSIWPVETMRLQLSKHISACLWLCVPRLAWHSYAECPFIPQGASPFQGQLQWLPLLWNVPDSPQWNVSLPHGISQRPRFFFFFWRLFQWNIVQKSRTRDCSFYLQELEVIFRRGPTAFNSRVSEGIVSGPRAETTTPTQALATVSLR